jgi:hypothetical protein
MQKVGYSESGCKRYSISDGPPECQTGRYLGEWSLSFATGEKCSGARFFQKTNPDKDFFAVFAPSR